MRKTNTNSSKRINEQLTLSNQKPRTRGALFLINRDSKKKLDILYSHLDPKLAPKTRQSLGYPFIFHAYDW